MKFRKANVNTNNFHQLPTIPYKIVAYNIRSYLNKGVISWNAEIRNKRAMYRHLD